MGVLHRTRKLLGNVWLWTILGLAYMAVTPFGFGSIATGTLSSPWWSSAYGILGSPLQLIPFPIPFFSLFLIYFALPEVVVSAYLVIRKARYPAVALALLYGLNLFVGLAFWPYF